MNRAIRLVAAVASALALAVPATAQERYTVGGGDVAIYNLAGEIIVTGSQDQNVTVEAMRGGRDAERLDIQVGEVEGRQTLRVIYPSDRITYDQGRSRSNTTLRVRRDGTWGGDGNRWSGRGDQVRVSSRSGGLDAHANLHVRVPAGHQVSVYLAVGRITASNVNGRIRLDTQSGGVEAKTMTGYLNVDTGSGSVDVRGMDGDLLIDTGSGRVRVADVTGADLGIDTGSGSVEADAVTARNILIDTGSGSISLRRSSGRDVRLDTGSGSVNAELTSDVDRLLVDTGSGSVTVSFPSDLSARLDIETGSGGIDVDFPVMITHRARDELHGTIGDGRGSITIDTGSGGVRIRRQ